MQAGFRVVFVEDDRALAGTLKAGLEEDGFIVDVAHTAAAGCDLGTSTDARVIVVDVMLPDGSGVDLVRKLRNRGVTAPILMLTARGDSPTTVRALEVGADAYVVKPVTLEALGARLRALHRRASGSGEVLRSGAIEFEPDRLMVFRDGVEIDLTPVQARLLEALMRHEDRVLTRSQLSDRVWPEGNLPGSNALDVHVRALRVKIDRDAPSPVIETVRGMGYRFRGRQRR